MKDKTVLVIGGGGREHAMVWALVNAPEVSKVYAAPGNPGTASIAENIAVNVTDLNYLAEIARDCSVDLVAIGPEVPLAAGLVNRLLENDIPAFGPTREAAQLEASKAFSKSFMQKYNIPTAAYAVFERYDDALRYVKAMNRPMVVKADGLAAGKGVMVCETVDEAVDALLRIFIDKDFGAAGRKVVIEERLTGPELSVMAFCDGETVSLMPAARDHKRVFDNDEGPNTGGMGAFAPVPGISDEFLKEIERTVIRPAVKGMAEDGICYKGVLYTGLMLTVDGPKTLEFNCRFGDPETQVILPLLESSLYEIMQRCIDGTLENMQVQWQDAACATVVAASGGYPGSFKKGIPIEVLRDDLMVFQAGTELNEDNTIITNGGRVLAVSAVADTLDEAIDQVYKDMQSIQFEGMHYRKDIGRS